MRKHLLNLVKEKEGKSSCVIYKRKQKSDRGVLLAEIFRDSPPLSRISIPALPLFVNLSLTAFRERLHVQRVHAMSNARALVSSIEIPVERLARVFLFRSFFGGDFSGELSSRAILKKRVYTMRWNFLVVYQFSE